MLAFELKIALSVEKFKMIIIFGNVGIEPSISPTFISEKDILVANFAFLEHKKGALIVYMGD